jgi:hypothetical protein
LTRATGYDNYPRFNVNTICNSGINLGGAIRDSRPFRLCQDFGVIASEPGDRPATDWQRVGRFSYLTREDRWEWSDEVARMHGDDPGTVTPTTELVVSHKHPDDKPTVAELIEQVRRHGGPIQQQTPHYRYPGQRARRGRRR